jgi:COP9 signalosome complex subunit 7
MAEQKSVAALQSYLALAKGVSGKACADIIMKATEAPGCYVFGELLDIPNIKALDESPEHQKVTPQPFLSYLSN